MADSQVSLGLNSRGQRGYTSRLPGLYRLSFSERLQLVGGVAGLSEDEIDTLRGVYSTGPEESAIENALGMVPLPLGIGTNLIVNGRDVLVPMVTEEPSVVAGFSNGARLVRQSGGVIASCDPPEMIGQIQLYDVLDPEETQQRIEQAEGDLLAVANATMPGMVARGGGARTLQVRRVATMQGTMLVVHLVIDVRDAMGANVVNTAAEAVGDALATRVADRVGVRILTNLATHRLARAHCSLPVSSLGTAEHEGGAIAQGIVSACAWADADPYRAATHNKGIMNGIDAVALATGNDWRAIEAGAHAWAAHGGHYAALTRWQIAQDDQLVGEIELPLAVGTRGSAIRAHAVARVAQHIMRVNTSGELAEIMAAVGLVQNLAALRALAAEGIQRGHMKLHARQIARAAALEGAEDMRSHAQHGEMPADTEDREPC